MYDARPCIPSLIPPSLILLALLGGCAISAKPELGRIEPQKVVLDDACELQPYFDTLAAAKVKPPVPLFANDLEREGATHASGGRARFGFETDFTLGHLRRLLNAHWDKVPPEVLAAPNVVLEVEWAYRVGVRRLVTDADAHVTVPGRTWKLAYHVCLNDLLYGEALYRTRRELFGPTPATAPAGPAQAAPPAVAPPVAPPSVPASAPPTVAPPAAQPAPAPGPK